MPALTNPYDHSLNSAESHSAKLQTDISAEDKTFLTALRPVRGTIQIVVNQLIHTFCHELRTNGITSYRPDIDDILSILLEPRTITLDQFERLRRTSLGASLQTPAGVLQPGGGTSVCAESANTPDVSAKPTRRTRGGKSSTLGTSTEKTVPRGAKTSSR